MSEEVSGEELVWMYKTMLSSRLFIEEIAGLYRLGVVKTAHLGFGQEAVAVGVGHCLRKDDYIMGAHRAHAHAIARGIPLEELAAEALGKATGICGGMVGSERIIWAEGGMLWSGALVGSNIPIATGVGYAIKLRKTDQVVACIFGDGASNVGDFHESLNLASLWKLPVIYICENNQWAQFTHVKRSTSIENIADRARAYNMPGVVVDGNDPVAVHKVTCEAVNRARKGGGPTLIECKTYRMRGHFEGDPADYRTKNEVEEWKKKDPIDRLKAKLLERGILKNKDLDKIDKEVKIKMDEVMKLAKECPDTPSEELTKHLF